MDEPVEAPAAPAEDEKQNRFVRVVSHDGRGESAHVDLVDGDGDVTPLPLVRAVTLRIEAGKPNVADVEMLVVDGDVSAELVRLREIALPPVATARLVVDVLTPHRTWYGLRRSTVIVRRMTPAASGFVVETLLCATIRPQEPVCFEAQL